MASAPPDWSFEGLGRTPARRTAGRYEVMHPVEARDPGPLEYAVRANECDSVVSFLQEGDRQRCEQEAPAPGAVPSGVAWAVNVQATEAVARAAVSEGKRVVVVSTDEVFLESAGPMAEAAEPVPWPENPSWYGATWTEAETLLGRVRGDVATLRVSALFGWSDRSGCERRLASELSAPRAGRAALCQPTFVPDAVAALLRLVEEPRTGRFHVALAEPIPRHQFAQALLGVHAGAEEAPPAVPERHPGLVPSRLHELGLAPTPASVAWQALRPRDRA